MNRKVICFDQQVAFLFISYYQLFLSMNLEIFLAMRYFGLSNGRNRFLSFIKIMAIGGVAVGAAGLLIALSIAHGFKGVISDKIEGFGADITISTFGNNYITESDSLLHFLNNLPEVTIAQSVIYGQALIRFNDRVDGVVVKGLNNTDQVTMLRNYTHQRVIDLSQHMDELPHLIAGRQIQTYIGASTGSNITLFSMRGYQGIIDGTSIKQFKLTDVYETGIDRFDASFVIIDQLLLRQMINLPKNSSSSIEIKLRDDINLDEFNLWLDKLLPYPLYSQTIRQTYSSIFAWVNLQEQTIPLVISVMVIVAAFNLIGSILMMVLERTGDIGVLKTMGITDQRIQKLFILEGFLIAVVGLIIGIGLAMGFNFVQSTWQVIPLPQENYYMSYAPVDPHLIDFIIVSITTLILCLISSVLPARVAARMEPLKVISFGKR